MVEEQDLGLGITLCTVHFLFQSLQSFISFRAIDESSITCSHVLHVHV